MYTLNPIGAFAKEVEGLSLWETQDELTIARLADIWSRHGVLVFRRQVLSETELVDFSRSFGDPDVIVREDWSSSHTSGGDPDQQHEELPWSVDWRPWCGRARLAHRPELYDRAGDWQHTVHGGNAASSRR